MPRKRRSPGEGSIYKKGGRWVAQIVLGRNDQGRLIRRWIYGRTREAVSDRLSTMQRAIDQHLPIPDERITVGQYLTWWLAEQAPKRLRERTLDNYRQTLTDHVIPFVGELSLAKLKPTELQAWVDARHAAGLSPRLCGYARAVLRSALQDAVRLELAVRNPARLVRVPRRQSRQAGQALSQAQAHALIAAIAGHRYDLLVFVALSLGLREGEVLGLTWSDLDVAGASLRVERQVQLIRDTRGKRVPQLVELKTEKSRRTLALHPAVLTAFQQQRARVDDLRRAAGRHWRGTDPLIFPSTAGTPIGPRNLAREWHVLRVRAGLPELRFHDLRHSATTFLLMLGVDLRTVMDMLGHSQVSTTLEHYAHALRPQVVEAASRMGALLEAKPKQEDREDLRAAKSPSRLTH